MPRKKNVEEKKEKSWKGKNLIDELQNGMLPQMHQLSKSNFAIFPFFLFQKLNPYVFQFSPKGTFFTRGYSIFIQKFPACLYVREAFVSIFVQGDLKFAHLNGYNSENMYL